MRWIFSAIEKIDQMFQVAYKNCFMLFQLFAFSSIVNKSQENVKNLRMQEYFKPKCVSQFSIQFPSKHPKNYSNIWIQTFEK